MSRKKTKAVASPYGPTKASKRIIAERLGLSKLIGARGARAFARLRDTDASSAGATVERPSRFRQPINAHRAQGRWTWGRNGQVDGTLLWPDAFRYLAGELGKAIDDWENGGRPLKP